MFYPLNFIIYIALITTSLLFIYFVIYTLYINNKIKSGKQNNKTLLSMPKAVVVSFILALFALCTVLIVNQKRFADANSTPLRNSCNIIDISNSEDYHYISSNNCEASVEYAKIYSPDSNIGYKKEIKKDGDFTYTIFTRTDQATNDHPDFLCFVEYTGNTTENFSCYLSTSFIDTNDEDSPTGMGSGGGEICPKMLFIGNLDENFDLSITLSLLDDKAEQRYFEADEKAYKEDKGIFPNASDFASSNSQVKISIPTNE